MTFWVNSRHQSVQGGTVAFTLKIRAPGPHCHLSPKPGPEWSWQNVSRGFLSLPWNLGGWLFPSSQPSQSGAL